VSNAIDNAVNALQALSLAMTSVDIKSAPAYPIENIDPLPMSVAYLAAGNLMKINYGMLESLKFFRRSISSFISRA